MTTLTDHLVSANAGLDDDPQLQAAEAFAEQFFGAAGSALEMISASLGAAVRDDVECAEHPDRHPVRRSCAVVARSVHGGIRRSANDPPASHG